MARVAARTQHAHLACPRCGRSAALELGSGSAACRTCRQDFLYLRLNPRPEPGPVAMPATAGAAACAKHARNAAVASCERCGAFVCDFCRIEGDARSLCPACFDRLAASGELASARNLIRNDGAQALVYGIIALIFPFFGFFLAPWAIWSGLRGRTAERKMNERLFGWRLWVGIIGGSTSLLLYGTLFLLLITKVIR